MKINSTIFLFTFLLSYGINAQYLNGKVVAATTDLGNISIVNASQKKYSTTDKNGFFTIEAAVNDSIKISAVQFNSAILILKKEDFEKYVFLVNLKLHTTYIEEVKVLQSQDGYQAGVLSKKAKTFTPAERKLNTASNMYPTANVGSMAGGSLGLDPLLNWISGRTKRLKQEVNVEQKELALQKINALFEEIYFTQTLKITEDKLEGFLYFIVEDSEFIKALSAKNKTMTKFLLVDLSKKYLNLQN